jgi:hypothetical protein
VGEITQEVQLERARHIGVRVADVRRAATGVRWRYARPSSAFLAMITMKVLFRLKNSYNSVW